MASSTTRIVIPFTDDSTADDVIAGIDLTGKRAIVTGASSGLGVETARALASAGAEVTLAVRDTEAGKRVASEITANTGNENVLASPLDLSSHASITAFVKAWNGKPLHILVNNAGIAALPEIKRTPEGWEQQFATNHLGHFELTLGLHDALAACHTHTGRPARVVVVSSRVHRHVVFEDIHYEHREYEGKEAYSQSKTANVLFAVEGSKQWAPDGITVNACCPGLVQTNILRYLQPDPARDKHLYAHAKTLQQAASMQVLLAASPLVEGVSGKYFYDNIEAQVVGSPGVTEGVWGPEGVWPFAIDPDNAARLWDMSLDMLKQRGFVDD